VKGDKPWIGSQKYIIFPPAVINHLPHLSGELKGGIPTKYFLWGGGGGDWGRMKSKLFTVYGAVFDNVS
jgi:hypothetical protein